MAHSPVPRLFLVLLSALALVLIGMESAAAGPPTCAAPGGEKGAIGECWTSWVNCGDCDEPCYFECKCCTPEGQGYWDGPYRYSSCSGSCPPPPPLCTDECSPSGARECYGLGYRTCGNYDADSCLEWSSVTDCPYGCSDGECNVANCCEILAPDLSAYYTRCVATPEECTIEGVNFCPEGAGIYTARAWEYPPGGTDFKTYYCKIPLNHSSMDPGASGAVTPCNTSAACADDGNCYNTSDTSRNADGDGDNDYCLGGTWYDCLADAQCIGDYHCSSNNCIPDTETNCTDGNDNDGDNEIDELDSDCCSWCESNVDWGWSLLGGSCSGATAMFWEDLGLQNPSCCGNSPNEEYEICEYLDIPGNDKISWASSCTSGDDGCCLSPGCVDPAANVCYDASFGYDIPSQSSSDSFSYCNAGGVWQDCDNSSGICGDCAGVVGFPCAGRASCWAKGGESAAFGEYDTGTATECCGDDRSEYFNRSIYHASIESPPLATTACCNSPTDCVNGSACYTNAITADVDSNGDADVCSAGTWLDCSADGALQCAGLCCAAGNCTPCSSEVGKCNDGFDNDGNGKTDKDDPDCCDFCKNSEGTMWFDFNAPGPETPLGCGLNFSMWELGGGFQQQWCCGNNKTTEFYKVNPKDPSIIACCNATTDCVDLPGVCRNGTEYSPGGCTDDLDHDCDGLNNFDDPDCRATIYGTVTEDDGTPEGGPPIPNATVTAVATDPVTGRVVQYSNVTNVSGNYLMNVTKGLDYDIVVVVPGYGTGFVWDHGPGNINFKIKKAENCEDDCTSPGESLCRPECHGINGCSFYGVGGAGGTRTCDGAKKDWIIPYFYDTDYELQCCEGAPAPRKRTQVVGVSGAKSVVRVTRIISYGGQLITLVIDVFK